MSAFADFQVNFGDTPTLPTRARRPENAWRAAGAEAGRWTAALAADTASPLARTRELAPWSAWTIGELARYDTLSAPADPLGAWLLDLRAGRANAALLDGHFVIFAWNAESHQWHVWTNRFGTIHAYSALGARRSALGTFHPAVSAAVGAERLDWEGLTGFFAMGFFPEDRTHFEEVRILRPATHYVFDDRGAELSAERYWQWAHRPDRVPEFGAALEMFDSTLSAVLGEQCAGGRIAFPISGGLDSRSVVAVATRRKARDSWFYSYGYGRESAETRIGTRVAEARGVPCSVFDIDEYLFDRMGDVMSATEGFNDVTQTRQVAVSAQLAEHSTAVIAAHWGDVWLSDSGVGDNALDGEQMNSFAFAKVAKEGRAWLLEHLCAPRVGARPEDAVRAAVSRELARVDQIADADFRMKAFKTDGWSHRWTAVGLRAYQLGAMPRTPFYDSRLTDLMCDLPTSFVRGRRLQVEWLKRFAPDLARVTWQAHDANLYWYPFQDSLLLPQRAVKKAWRILSGAAPVERNWEVQFLSPNGRRRLEASLLTQGRRVHEFVSPAAIRDLLDRFFANPLAEKRGYTVSMLLTFSEWLERYA